MSISTQRERIQIETAVETISTGGQPVKEWQFRTSLWARVRSLTGREVESFKQITSEVQKAFEMNYRTDIAVKERIVWFGSSWNIHDIQPDERKFEMTIYASRVK